MSDLLKLPNQGDAYFRKALTMIENHNYKCAIDYLKKSYQSDNNQKALIELAYLFLNLEMYTELKNLWNDNSYLLNFPTSLEVLTIYIQSLPKIKKTESVLLILYQLRDEYADYSDIVTLIQEKIDHLHNQQKLSIELKELDSCEKIDQYTQHFMDQSPNQQLKQLKQLYLQPYELTKPIFLKMLSEDILQFIKSDILHHILSLDSSQNIEFIWFNEKYKLSINDIKPYHQYQAYNETYQLLKAYAQKNNPHIEQELLEQFTMHSLIFYPFIDQVIDNPSQWISVFLYVNGIEDIPLQEIDQDLLNHIQRANSELFQLFNE